MSRVVRSRRRHFSAHHFTHSIVEALEGRTLLTVATINVGTTVRTIVPNMLGTNTAPWDTSLTNSTVISLAKGAGINSIRIGGGSYVDGTSGDTTGWHFDVNNQNNSLRAQLSFMSSIGATGLIDMDYGTASPQEDTAELAYLNAPIDNSTIDNVTIGPALAFNGSATANNNGQFTGGWGGVGGVTESGVTSWQTVGFWATLRSQTPAANPTNSDGLNFLRIGQTAPFGFHYFEIGNEVYGTTWEADAQGAAAPNYLTA